RSQAAQLLASTRAVAGEAPAAVSFDSIAATSSSKPMRSPAEDTPSPRAAPLPLIRLASLSRSRSNIFVLQARIRVDWSRPHLLSQHSISMTDHEGASGP